MVDGRWIAGPSLVGVSDAIFGDHDVAMDIRGRVENAQLRGMRPATAVSTGALLLSHLVPQVRPAPQSRRQLGSGPLRGNP